MAQTAEADPATRPSLLASRVFAALAALILAGGLGACALNLAPAPLTAEEWAFCQQHWQEGLDPSQRGQPQAGTWFFNHMGMREDPDTIRVCRAAARNPASR
jgi:hypothetical protein